MRLLAGIIAIIFACVFTVFMLALGLYAISEAIKIIKRGEEDDRKRTEDDLR